MTPARMAYIVAHDVTPESTELRSYLHKALPAYMVPAHFVFLDAAADAQWQNRLPEIVYVDLA
ncbi:MAG: hypothetical protein R2911_31980 [Caldilineaceae bacterium]